MLKPERLSTLTLVIKLTIISLSLSFSAWTFSNCELFDYSSGAPHGDRSLSKFWAQEFTGADLVRADLEKHNVEVPKNLIGVWDAKSRGIGSHGERVSQLIIGPYKSALLPGKNSIKYEDVEFERGAMEPADKFIALFKNCSQRKSCPEFINNSMSWLKSSEIKNIVSKMAANQILLVTSAGNSRGLVESGKRDLANDKKIVIVGNTNVYGFPAKLTDSAPEVTVSAPSDNSLTTYDYAGNLKNFSGTSGSAPQVLASLASFRLITGMRVDGELAKLLLQSTALKILPQPNNIGAGSLNAYKIFELAKIVKKKCSRHSVKCAKNIIRRDLKMVSHNFERDLYRYLQKAFPVCANGSSYQRMFPDNSCKRKQSAYTDLRRVALLKANDPKPWKILHCITDNEGFGKNAQFYKNLYRHVGKTNNEKIADYLEYNTDADLIKFSLSNPEWILNPKSVATVIKRAQVDWTIDNYLLAHKAWRNYFTKFLQENGDSSSPSASKIRQFL